VTDQGKGKASEQSGSRSTTGEGPRASGEGTLLGLAHPQAGDDLEASGGAERPRGFVRGGSTSASTLVELVRGGLGGAGGARTQGVVGGRSAGG
jgi:hypothetical protein